jgi:L-ascorbate metabolism protein UlaG (beta-lactamase superfamily)
MSINRILISLLLLTCIPTEIIAQSNCKTTYIANEGFIIEVGDKKIIVDGLFDKILGSWCDSPSDTMLKLIKKAQAPFDNIDLIAITHNHRDHFNEAIVSEYMLSNKKAKIICPKQVQNSLSQNENYDLFIDRIISITPEILQDSNIIIQGIPVRVMRLEHSHYMEDNPETGGKRNRHRNVENLGFLFNFDGYTIYHCGDTNPLNEKEYKTFALQNKNIDLAFLERMFISNGKPSMDILNNYIAPKSMVFMHINPANKAAYTNHFKAQENIKIFENKLDTLILNY